MANTDKIVYLPQLQRYDEKIKGWADGKFLKKTDAYSLPNATTTTLGGVKIGTGLNVASDGTASINQAYVDGRVTAVGDEKYALKTDIPAATPMATESVAGLVYAKSGTTGNAYGEVRYETGRGLFLDSIVAGSITKTELDSSIGSTLNTIDDVIETELPDLRNRVGNLEANVENVYKKTETYSKTEVDNKVSAALTSAIVPKGTVTYANLPTPAKANLGYMYNVSDEFTTDARFVDGAGKKYAAGANVYVVAVTTGGSTEYKFDVFMGFVDLSGYQTKADMPGAATNEDIDAMFAPA